MFILDEVFARLPIPIQFLYEDRNHRKAILLTTPFITSHLLGRPRQFVFGRLLTNLAFFGRALPPWTDGSAHHTLQRERPAERR